MMKSIKKIIKADTVVENKMDVKRELTFTEKLNVERESAAKKFLEKSIRLTRIDQWFKQKKIHNANFSNTHFTRVVSSKETQFLNVDFSYCIFEHAYIRACSFDNCDFTGAKFINTNLQGSSFINCDFRYAIFEKSLIDDDFIFSNLPKESNLRQKLLRSLRVNFQQLGDSENVNKSILYELDATDEYLWDATFSSDKYYQDKYGGIQKRFLACIRLLNFKIWEFVWGNGEKVWKLFRFFILTLSFIVIYDIWAVGLPKADSLNYVYTSLKNSFAIFFGVYRPDHFSDNFCALVMFFRLFLFALFISIMVKRLNRR